MNIVNDKVHCHKCDKWYDIEADTFMTNEGEIYCVRCWYGFNRLTLLGYIWDLKDD